MYDDNRIILKITYKRAEFFMHLYYDKIVPIGAYAKRGRYGNLHEYYFGWGGSEKTLTKVVNDMWKNYGKELKKREERKQRAASIEQLAENLMKYAAQQGEYTVEIVPEVYLTRNVFGDSIPTETDSSVINYDIRL